MKKVITKISILGMGIFGLTINANAQWTRNAGTHSTFLTNKGDSVGIGTSAPAFKLDIQSVTNATMSLKSTTGNGSIQLDKGNVSSNASVTYRTAGSMKWQTGCVSNNNYTIRNNSLGQVAVYCDNADN